jgi:hypothetical protein
MKKCIYPGRGREQVKKRLDSEQGKLVIKRRKVPLKQDLKWQLVWSEAREKAVRGI